MARVFPLCFPSADLAFRRVVEDGLVRDTTPAAAQRRLSGSFPGIVVHRQQELARTGFGREIWYFYRDGGPAPHPR